MKKVFISLWVVVGFFLLGIFLVIFTAFTTKTTHFSGAADLHLRFEGPEHKVMAFTISDVDHVVIPASPDGSYLLHPKFESRETNFFDTFNGGPHPRTSVVAFFEDQTKHHEITFTYDRHGHVWQAEIAFPDPTINDVQLENSTLKFAGPEGERRRYESVITAKALVGPPIIKND